MCNGAYLKITGTENCCAKNANTKFILYNDK